MKILRKASSVFLFVCVLCSMLLVSCINDNTTASEVQFDADEVIKSQNDRREYRSLVLKNDLKVLLISDPETDKAAASVDINSGSNSDPIEFAGLAHFLEHMLFLGTEKYPEAGEYQEYIASHGGSHNAYTAYENTNYFFDIEEGFLEPALDRFSQFFIAPLFTPEYVDRERNAVHSEYQSNLQNDGRRSYAILKAVINQKHPLSQFSVGSLETLQDKSAGTLGGALSKHYEENYSANIMTVAILGSESLDELEVLARRHFSQVNNNQVLAPSTDEKLFLPGQLPALIEVNPVRDNRSLSFSFPIPVVKQYYKSKPLRYLGNIIGHEGEGSLLSLLKSQGWVNALSAGGGMSYQNNASFSISLALTEEGVSKVDEISQLVFQYIELVKQEGVHEWLFNEQKTLAELSFLFQEPAQPISSVSSLSRALQEYPASEIITANYAYENFDSALILNILDYLTADNVLLTLTSKSLQTELVEVNFGGDYSVNPIANSRTSTWAGNDADPKLKIPKPNPFMPGDLAIKAYEGQLSSAGVNEKPTLFLDGNGTRLWFKQDNEFHVPRANFYLYGMTPLFNSSLKNTLLSNFVVNLVNDQLNEYSYPANLAGVFYGVSRRSRGFTLRLGGYEDKQAILLEKLLATIVAADFSEERFTLIKAESIRSWQNASKQMPYRRLFQKVQALLVNPYWSEQQKIAAVADITLEEVKAFVPEMLKELRIEALYHGNVKESDALAMMDIVNAYLQSSAKAPIPDFGSIVNLPDGERIVQEIEVEHDDSAIVIYMQAPDTRLVSRAKLNLLAALIRTPFFDTLRTEKQLGYVVNASTMPLLNVSSLLMYIESPGYDPLALEKNIDEFIASYDEQLAGMTETLFVTTKAGLLNNLRQPPQRLSSLSSRYWSDILIEEYAEDSILAMADMIETLTKQDIVNYYRAYIGKPNAGRLVARSVGIPHLEIFSSNLAVNGNDEVRLEDSDSDYQAFKAEAEVYLFNPQAAITE